MEGRRSKVIIGVAGIVLLLAAVAGVLALNIARNNRNAAVTDFQSCVDNGYKVTGTNPQQCTGPDGKVYTGPRADQDSTSPADGDTTGRQPPATSPPVQNDRRQTISLQVYFSKDPESLNDFTYTQAAVRSSSRADMGTYTIEQLIAGPTGAEASRGLFSPLKGKLQGDSNCNGKDFSLSVSNRTARLKFCKTVASAGTGDDARITSTVTDTLQQFSTVDSVIILTRDGNCFGDMSGQNRCLQ